MLKLFDVYTDRSNWHSTLVFLYDLLAEREPHQNISHREMPSFEQHRRFVESKPYKAWYIVQVDGDQIGMTYLTAENEIGIFVAKDHQGHGYGKDAVLMLMKAHPEKRFLANIAPRNSRSVAMFEGMGFELVQYTLAKDGETK